MPEAGHEVVVDHSGGLHEGVADGGADEGEAALLQLLAHLLRLRRLRRHLGGAPAVLDGLAADQVPEERVEAAGLVADGEEGAGVDHRRRDLGAVADDARVRQESGGLLRTVAGDDFGIEIVEGTAVAVPAAQDGDPGESGLRSLQDEHLEQAAVVVQRHTPLLVVVGDVERIAGSPAAAGTPVVSQSLLHDISLFQWPAGKTPSSCWCMWDVTVPPGKKRAMKKLTAARTASTK